MATTTTRKLALGFTTGTGSTATLTFAHAQENPDSDDVAAAMDAVLTNAEVFKNPPVAKKSAKVITTTSVDIPIAA